MSKKLRFGLILGLGVAFYVMSRMLKPVTLPDPERRVSPVVPPKKDPMWN